jgi:hypothetical protein
LALVEQGAQRIAFSSYLGASRRATHRGSFQLALQTTTLPGLSIARKPVISSWCVPRPRLPKNDGWVDIAYDLGTDPEDNARISAILNEACHVFHHHPQGAWTDRDKDSYARKLAAEIEARPGLVGRLLAADDRAVKMLTHRAVELLQNAAASSPSRK